MLRLIPFLIVVALAFALVADAGAAQPAEDSPDFCWVIDGNGQRGVWLRPGAILVGKRHPDGKRLHRVVNVRQYVRAERRGSIDHARTERLLCDPLVPANA